MDMWTAIAVMTVAISAAVSTRKIATAWLARRASPADRLLLDRLEAMQAQLVRLERTAEATALEVERLGEGQRYLVHAAAAAGARPPAVPAPSADALGAGTPARSRTPPGARLHATR